MIERVIAILLVIVGTLIVYLLLTGQFSLFPAAPIEITRLAATSWA